MSNSQALGSIASAHVEGAHSLWKPATMSTLRFAKSNDTINYMHLQNPFRSIESESFALLVNLLAVGVVDKRPDLRLTLFT
jgi:hypothetical protein